MQLTKSARAQRVNFCVDTGSANALSVAFDPPLTEYKQGLPIRILVKNDNTGSTTININSLGNRQVVRANGAALQADDLRVGMIALMVDDGTRFQLVNYLGAVGGTVNTYMVDIPYAEDTGTVNNIIGIYTPPIASVVSGDLIMIKVANKNTAAVMFTVNSLSPAPIRRTDGQPVQAYDIDQGEILLLVYNVTYWQLLRLARSQLVFKLNQNLILYVRPDGDDINGDGSANTAAKAFKTVQRAIDYVKDSFMIAGRTVTIQLGIPGTYLGRAVISNVPGRVILRGDPANAGAYVIQALSSESNVVAGSGSGIDFTIQGMTLAAANGSGNFIECHYGATVTTDNVWLSGVPISGSGIYSFAGNVIIMNYLHAYSNMGALMGLSGGATFTSGLWSTSIWNHGNSYNTAFVAVSSNSIATFSYGYTQFAGNCYGPRFIGVMGSVINTGSGGNREWLPGNQAGNTDSSSTYY